MACNQTADILESGRELELKPSKALLYPPGASIGDIQPSHLKAADLDMLVTVACETQGCWHKLVLRQCMMFQEQH